MFRQTVLPILLVFAASCGVGLSTGTYTPGSPATIESFAAAPASITAGQTATLAASFSNGIGIIDQGIGPVLSGSSMIVSPSSTTTYTLTVLDASAHAVTRTATVTVGSTGGPPVATITASPPSLTSQTTATFSFSSSTSDSIFSCALDSGAVAACASPRNYSGLTAGSHTFTVTATDKAGQSSSPVSFTWSLDMVPPVATITASPGNPTAQTSASFSFSSSKASSTFNCQLDSGAAGACASPRSYSALLAGSHTFTVAATDQAGNTSSPASLAWTIDLTAPVVTITSSPATLTNQTTASFSFTSNQAGSTFSCALDSAAAAACTSPQSYSGLAAGSHSFTVTATDPAGNTSSPVPFSWTINMTALVASITGSPANPTNQSTATFSFTSSQAGSTFTCALDSTAAAACTSPQTYSALAGGSHTFSVTATAPSGSVSSPATFAWTIDLVVPVVTVTASPPGLTNQTTATFSFSSSQAGSSFSCKLDSGAAAACSSPRSYSGLTAGSHTFTVTATDPAGNASSPASSTWTIDLTAPVASLTASPVNPTNQTTASFSFSSSQAGSTFSCKLDSGAAAACTSPQSYPGLASGSHAFTVTATDPAGNASGPVSYAWTIDLTPPVVTITATPANPTPQTTASFSFTSSKAGSSFKCTLDSGAAAACTSPQSYSGLANGSHTFSLTATDSAGNVSTPATFIWTIAVQAGSGLVISSPLTLDKTTVAPGDTLNGTITYQNTGSSAVSILNITTTSRPPGGTNAGGPYDHLTPSLAAQAIAAGATVTLAASRAFTAADPSGSWYAYSTYQDAGGVWHDGPSVNFTVAVAPPPPPPPPPPANGNYSSYAVESARCAAEPIRSTGTKHYFCDCKSGAAAGCQAGSDANDGLSIATPKQLFATASSLFQAMPAGDTILLCKGGAFDGNSAARFLNGNCRANNTCDVRDYVDTRNGHTDPNKKPIVFSSNAGQASIFDFSDGDRYAHEEGYRFLNLDLEGGAAALRAFFLYDDVSDVFICNNTINSFTSAVVQNESGCGSGCPATPSSNKRLTVRGNLFTNNSGIAFLGSGDSQVIEYNYFDQNGNGSILNHPLYNAGVSWNGVPEVIRNEVVRGNEFYHSNLVNGTCNAAIITGHGQHANMTVEANIITQVAGTAGPGCWGIGYDSGNYGSAEGFTNLIIRANRVTDVGNSSIGTMMCVNCIIENNLIIQDSGTMGADGIVVPDKGRNGVGAGSFTTTGMIIRNNTIWFSAGNGSGIRLDSDGATGTGNIVTNNAIMVNGASSPFSCFSLNQPASSYYMDRNDCYFPNLASTRWEANNGATLSAWKLFSGLDSSSITINPLFTNQGGDFTTQASSPLRSAGDSLSTHFALTDILGRTRALPPDIGAYNQ